MVAPCPQPVMITTTGRIGEYTTLIELIYDPSDPWAIVMIPKDKSGSVPWVFARDLLDEGLVARNDGEVTGEGDVVFARTSYDVLTITLRTPWGQADIAMSAEVLIDFLEDTFAQVRAGEEASMVDWNVELSRVRSGL
ncbi:SsgA family sporulation/cell division regulator [Lentzea sp. NBRC 102530]|uniref:SsgA family sporulation/cell division regulator n=1 Tax=Lentzea sp. NBRC 102530 TaxID=3032201 RepID=UPI0024A09CDA|nr:SsgA family sporulation/cell division regulator [Lentzea sp. NBRC 102530]GLY54888.1 sporulation protein SsgA [Lentzea sp. NBRC 102530]